MAEDGISGHRVRVKVDARQVVKIKARPAFDVPLVYVWYTIDTNGFRNALYVRSDIPLFFARVWGPNDDTGSELTALPRGSGSFASGVADTASSSRARCG